MGTLLLDIRYGLRSLLRRPGFTAIGAITLALGVGGNAAMFSFVDAAILRPLKFSDPERLMVLTSTNLKRGVEQGEVSLDDYLDWQTNLQSFSEIAAYGPWGFNITGENEAEKITSVVATPNLFKTLGVAPLIGRSFLPEETIEGKHRVVVIGHSLWQRRYGGDANLVGRALILDGASYTVVGVMPADFYFPNREVEMWAPLDLTPDESSRRSRWLKVIGRLIPQTSKLAAENELALLTQRLAEKFPDSNFEWGAAVMPLREVIVKDSRRALVLLLAAVVFVLLIACVNIANLQLARLESRSKELAVRAALGAGRGRLLRLSLIESLGMAFIGGALGLVLAFWSLELLTTLIPRGALPGPDDLALLQLTQVHLNLRVLGFAFLISLAAGVLIGVLPAAKTLKLNLHDALKQGGAASCRPLRMRLRGFLVVAQVALTLVLLTGAGLLVRSFVRLIEQPKGFRSEGLLTFRISPASKYRQGDQRAVYFRQLMDSLATLPQVQAVGSTTTLPFSGTDLNTQFIIEGAPENPQPASARFGSITGNYFQAMGISLIRGRFFNERDNSNSANVVIINEEFARLYFPGEETIGRQLKTFLGGERFSEVIGVVSNVRQDGLDSQVKPEIYVSGNQRPWFFASVVVRTNGDPLNLTSSLRKQIWAIDKDIPVYNIATMEQRIADSVAKRRFSMVVTGGFALLAVALAATGIFGVASYAVNRRRQEFGIRMAVGAQPGDVFRLVLFEGMIWIVLGLLIGGLGALALSRLMSSLVFGVSTTDPLTMVAVSTLLTLVALLACVLPARRATKVDPVLALRSE